MISHANIVANRVVMQWWEIVIIDKIFGVWAHQNAITPSWTPSEHIIFWQCGIFFVRIRGRECNWIFNKNLLQWLQFTIELLQLKHSRWKLSKYYFADCSARLAFSSFTHDSLNLIWCSKWWNSFFPMVSTFWASASRYWTL